MSAVPLLAAVEEERPDKSEPAPGPEECAGFLSRASFGWIYSTLARGVERGGLTFDDLPPATSVDDPARVRAQQQQQQHCA